MTIFNPTEMLEPYDLKLILICDDDYDGDDDNDDNDDNDDDACAIFRDRCLVPFS